MTKRERAPALPRENADVYTDLFLVTLPLLAFSVFLYGPRSLTLYLVAVVTANLCDRLVALLRARPFEPNELSNEAFAAMLVVLFPATVSYYVVVVSVLAAVLVGKEAFGGYGSYVFHPTAVGYTIAAVSWPEQVCRYPQPFSNLPVFGPSGVSLVESTSYTLKNNGLPNISALNLLIGNYAGPMGASAALIVLAAALYLRVRRRLPFSALVGFFLGCAAVVWVAPRVGNLPLSWSWEYTGTRLEALKYEMFSGAIPFAGVFLLCDPYTVPKNRVSRFVFGVLVGLIAVVFRYYGTYEAGVCFAMLFTNCVSGWVDRTVMRRLKGSRRRGAAL